jgi:peptidyl-prolyl cis-trans isomerase A (cyclophilin A)
MIQRRYFIFFLISLFLVWKVSAQRSSRSVPIIIETEFGTIEAELYPRKAPITCENFLSYVDSGAFENGSFYRTVKLDNQPGKTVLIEVIQGSVNLSKVDTNKIKDIPLERTSVTGLHHENGTLSMARLGPDTGNVHFFICIGDQPSLDFGGKRNPDGQGFAAFGKVTKGMEIVRKIQKATAKEQNLTPPVKILSVKRKGRRGVMN